MFDRQDLWNRALSACVGSPLLLGSCAGLQGGYEVCLWHMRQPCNCCGSIVAPTQASTTHPHHLAAALLVHCCTEAGRYQCFDADLCLLRCDAVHAAQCWPSATFSFLKLLCAFMVWLVVCNSLPQSVPTHTCTVGNPGSYTTQVLPHNPKPRSNRHHGHGNQSSSSGLSSQRRCLIAAPCSLLAGRLQPNIARNAPLSHPSSTQHQPAAQRRRASPSSPLSTLHSVV